MLYKHAYFYFLFRHSIDGQTLPEEVNALLPAYRLSHSYGQSKFNILTRRDSRASVPLQVPIEPISVGWISDMDTQPANRLTILFADIAGSTRLYDTFGDAKARELISECLSHLKELTRENNGTVIKTIGDEVMSVLASWMQFHFRQALRRSHSPGKAIGFPAG